MKRLVLLLLALCGSSFSHATTWVESPSSAPFDVIHYSLRLEPEINQKSLTGKESIKLAARHPNLSEIEFNCGELTIDSVNEGGTAQKFIRRENRLIISLSRPAKLNEAREIQIEYHGSPRRGIRFFPDRQQVYTVFSTSQWMVCVDAPDDRAMLSMTLILPPNLTAIANGSPSKPSAVANGKIAHEWVQRTPVPTYTFGFSVGNFRVVRDPYRDHLEFWYVSEQYSEDDLRRIFRDTRDMLEFYQQKAGVSYDGRLYSQVLAAGGVEQEMSGFTALRETYGRELLANERAIWLGAHEFAHQWWGNMVTNRDWTHFWLNEGMASFMASAYKEHRFGRAEYLKDIEEYRLNYEKVRSAGKDRSLVFPDWNSPTREDRTLVYDKGAYVLHLLRQELGDQVFWRGIRQYTQKYFGKSVTTADFQNAMEQASKRSLKQFFDRWVYLNA